MNEKKSDEETHSEGRAKRTQHPVKESDQEADTDHQPLPEEPSTIYAAQCNECLKWRSMSEEHYEEIRSKLEEEPFFCRMKDNTSCNEPADIEYDTCRIWVIDKPNIPKPPPGFKRELKLRKNYSKFDAFYITPTGTRLRSTPEAARYLDGNPEVQGGSASDFSFSVPKIIKETVPEMRSPSGNESTLQDSVSNTRKKASSSVSRNTIR